MVLTAEAWAAELGLPLAQVRRQLKSIPKSGDGWAIGAAARALLDSEEQLKPGQRVQWLRSELKRQGLLQADGELIAADEYSRQAAELLKGWAQCIDVLPDLLEAERGLSPALITATIDVLDKARNRAADRIAGRGQS